MQAKTFRKILSVAIFLILLPLVIDGAQTQTGGLRFITPQNGATFEPGSLVTVVVEPEGPTPLKEVVISTEGTIKGADTSPFQIEFMAPQDLGPQKLAVIAQDQQQQEFLKEIVYNVETVAPTTGIKVTDPPLFVGTERGISVSGSFAHEITRDISRSTEIVYTSSNTEAATITPDGIIQPVENGTATISVAYKDQSLSFPIEVDFEPLGRLSVNCARLQFIVSSNSGTPLADKVEDARAKCETALDELTKKPPDKQAAVGNIEGAVGDLEAAVSDGLLESTQGTRRMDQLARTSRQLAQETLDQAIAQGGDSVVIADAQQALAEGDTLRESGAFKDAVSKYKDALAKAESAIS